MVERDFDGFGEVALKSVVDVIVLSGKSFALEHQKI